MESSDIAHIRQSADANRFLFEVWLNVLVTTDVHYKYGWDDFVPAVGDVVDITNKYRANGTIL
jgi:hypothetical protein